MKERSIAFWKRSAAMLCAAVLTAGACNLQSLPLPMVSAAAETAIYVSPDGSDTNDGSLEKPLQSLAGARDAVRKLNKDMSGDIVVYLRGGTYRLTESVKFGVEDSGSNGHKIIYRAYEDETPIISGAVPVTGWKKSDGNLYEAPLDRDYKLRNFYINDHRANMGSIRAEAQGGYGTYGITAGQADWAWDSGMKSDGIKYKPGDFPAIYTNKDDLEVVNGTTWNENVVCSRDLKIEGGDLVLYLQQPYGAIAQTPGWGAGFSCGGWHTIFNAYAFVDEPGEFFFDKTEHKVYYYPYDWEDMSTSVGEAPMIDELLVIGGNSTTDRVHDLEFSGLTFAHTDYNLTDVAGSHGKTTCQAAQTYHAFADSNWHKYIYEMVDTLPSAINVTSCDNITFTSNVVKHTGADGIGMTNDVVNSTITGNLVTDITSSGITIGHPQHVYIGDKAQRPREKFDVGVEGLCKNSLVADNLLYNISVVSGFGGCAAITVYFGDGVQLLRNQIENTAYNGIHLGWAWCEFPDSTSCKNITINNNRVINCLNRLHDSGGIYTIGQMPGTVINENYVVGIPAGGPGWPTYGLHNDEGTAYIEECDNVLDISPDVTYTINCEDYGKKHDLTILRTYATVKKMGINPPSSRIDDPIVVSDNVWPQPQYEICLRSGLQDTFKHMIPEGMMTDADYIFPASCATKGGATLPIRKAGTGKTVWIAPDNTTTFKAGSTMTKTSGTSTKIITPDEAGEYRIFVTDASGKVLSKSQHLLRLKGTSSGVDATSADIKQGVEPEECSEGGMDIAFIEDGDYIGFKGVDFGSGAESIDMRVASPNSGNSIEIRLDAPDGKLIGTADVPETGGWQDWKTVTTKLDKATGQHDMYLVFKGGESYLFNIASYKLSVTGAGEVRLGDVNYDDSIDARDLTMLKQIAISGDFNAAADLNGDGSVDAADAKELVAYLTGKSKAFSAA